MAQVPSIRQILIAEIEAEAAATRRTLERVPQDRWDWAPHEKSMVMGRLAGWLSRMLFMIPAVLSSDSTDMSADAGLPPAPTRAAELLPTFDGSVSAATGALEAASDEAMGGMWSLRGGDQIYWGPVPKYEVVRSFFLADLIHHRAQLGVYLRLCGLAVPAVYGPSADEAP